MTLGSFGGSAMVDWDVLVHLSASIVPGHLRFRWYALTESSAFDGGTIA